MNNQQQQQQQQAYDGQGSCCFHPRKRVVGVCAHCLKERLLLLHDNHHHHHAVGRVRRTNSSISLLPKQVLALGSSFLQRLDSRHQHRGYDDGDDDATSSVASSLDDSFISIKFEDNGKATWDSQQHKVAVADDVEAGKPASTVVLVEHVKRGGVTRWRKQVVGRLLQLARWRRSAAKAGGADAKKAAEWSKARGRGWIRSLTRRRAAAAHGDRAW